MMEHSYKLILDSGMHTLGELRIIRTAKFNYMAGEKVKIEQLGWVIKHDNPYLLMWHFLILLRFHDIPGGHFLFQSKNVFDTVDGRNRIILHHPGM